MIYHPDQLTIHELTTLALGDTCPNCEGCGEVEHFYNPDWPMSWKVEIVTCKKCNGLGKV